MIATSKLRGSKEPLPSQERQIRATTEHFLAQIDCTVSTKQQEPIIATVIKQLQVRRRAKLFQYVLLVRYDLYQQLGAVLLIRWEASTVRDVVQLQLRQS